MRGSCIILIGTMGAGKSSVGWYLARSLGLGFIDLDTNIEQREKKTIAALFEEKGEAHFRALEAAEVVRLKNLRNHVIAVGGGAAVDDANWDILEALGVTVWLNPPANEIARRLLADELELRKRPLLADVLDQRTAPERHKLLTERVTALIGNRLGAYKRARAVISDSFSTPESTARLIRDVLRKDGLLAAEESRKSFDRWQIM